MIKTILSDPVFRRPSLEWDFLIGFESQIKLDSAILSYPYAYISAQRTQGD